MAIEGELHVHITIEATAEALERLHAWRAPRGLGFTHIVLDRGRAPSQPMLTWRTRGDADVRLDEARALAAELEAAGFRVTRLKLEAAPSADGVPEYEAPTDGRYFEHHVKLQLDADWSRPALEALLEPHHAHLSRNALARAENGAELRFATQRVCDRGRVRARAELDRLVAVLVDGGYRVVEVEQEYNVYDSRRELDAGWIEER